MTRQELRDVQLAQTRDLIRRAESLAETSGITFTEALRRLSAEEEQAAVTQERERAAAADPPPAATFMECAQSLVAAKKAPDLISAMSQAAARWPQLYDEYCAALPNRRAVLAAQQEPRSFTAL